MGRFACVALLVAGCGWNDSVDTFRHIARTRAASRSSRSRARSTAARSSSPPATTLIAAQLPPIDVNVISVGADGSVTALAPWFASPPRNSQTPADGFELLRFGSDGAPLATFGPYPLEDWGAETFVPVDNFYAVVQSELSVSGLKLSRSNADGTQADLFQLPTGLRGLGATGENLLLLFSGKLERPTTQTART